MLIFHFRKEKLHQGIQFYQHNFIRKIATMREIKYKKEMQSVFLDDVLFSSADAKPVP